MLHAMCLEFGIWSLKELDTSPYFKGKKLYVIKIKFCKITINLINI